MSIRPHAGSLRPRPGDSSLHASSQRVRALKEGMRAQLVETGISWVIVGPSHAWKIKKPLRLPFLDYSTLEARRQACEAELAVNHRFAPALYEAVDTITGEPGGPAFGGPGPVLDYAVRMRRFEEDQLFSARLSRDALAGSEVDALARFVAAFQADAPRASATDRMGLPAMRASFAQSALHGARTAFGRDALDDLQHWLAREAALLDRLWGLRMSGGFVREGHGDLHLANLLSQADGSVCAFDAVEFDPRLRWIDTLDDAAFPFMDFAAHGRSDLAFRFLNGWLDANGDHQALPALRFAACYRALVRCGAQLMCGRLHEARSYARQAVAWTGRPQPHVMVTHGLPGSGKSTQARKRAGAIGAIHIRSDVERKRLFGLGELDSSAPRDDSLYTQAATAATYDRLFEAAGCALAGGFAVILDATFLSLAQRRRARQFAHDKGARFTILHCDAPVDVLVARLAQRTGDASEADERVLRRAMATQQGLAADEWPFVERCDDLAERTRATG